jgi:hypothetical protein
MVEICTNVNGNKSKLLNFKGIAGGDFYMASNMLSKTDIPL